MEKDPILNRKKKICVKGILWVNHGMQYQWPVDTPSLIALFGYEKYIACCYNMWCVSGRWLWFCSNEYEMFHRNDKHKWDPRIHIQKNTIFHHHHDWSCHVMNYALEIFSEYFLSSINEKCWKPFEKYLMVTLFNNNNKKKFKFKFKKRNEWIVVCVFAICHTHQAPSTKHTYSYCRKSVFLIIRRYSCDHHGI